MRVIFLFVAALALLFVAGFGGLRGIEQFGAADDLAAVSGVASTVGGALGDIADAVGGDNAVADGIRSFGAGATEAEETVNAVRRGAIGMIATGALALFMLIGLLMKSRGTVVFFGLLVVVGAVVTWIMNPAIDLGPLSGLTQQVVDMGPMSDTSPKTVAMLLGGVGILGAFLGMSAETLRKREAAPA